MSCNSQIVICLDTELHELQEPFRRVAREYDFVEFEEMDTLPKGSAISNEMLINVYVMYSNFTFDLPYSCSW